MQNKFKFVKKNIAPKWKKALHQDKKIKKVLHLDDEIKTKNIKKN